MAAEEGRWDPVEPDRRGCGGATRQALLPDRFPHTLPVFTGEDPASLPRPSNAVSQAFERPGLLARSHECSLVVKIAFLTPPCSFPALEKNRCHGSERFGEAG